MSNVSPEVARDLLLEAAQFLDTHPDRWTSGEYVVTRETMRNKETALRSAPDKCQVCAIGAVALVALKRGTVIDLPEGWLFGWVEEEVIDENGGSSLEIMEENDRLGREAAVAALKNAAWLADSLTKWNRQVAEDTCEQHRTFCCSVCFDMTAA